MEKFLRKILMEKLGRRWLQNIIMPLALLFLVACNSESAKNDSDLDTDGDGLSDVDEIALGTSPFLKDSDGDGFSDFQEVIEFGFNPDNNNFRFNPLIADVPKIRIEIMSVPAISLLYETTDNQSKTISTERSDESAKIVTKSDTSSNSSSVEEAHSVGASVTADASITGGVSGTVSYEYSHATTSETGFSNTAEQSKENRQALSQGEAFESGSSLTSSGGALSVILKIINDGDTAFTVENLVLSAVMVSNNGELSPIANLNLDTNFNSFGNTSLAGGASTGNLTFINGALDLGTTKRLLSDASGLIVSVASSEIIDEDGVAFAFRQNAVTSNTATIIIDYGGKRVSERYLVATNTVDSSGRVNSKQTLEKILNVPYEVDANGSLSSLRNIAASASVNSYWLSLFVTTDGVETSATTFDADSGGYDFNNLSLKAGDVLHLMYVEDSDFDNLGLRAEFFAGTDPDNSDTDGDGLLDGEEVTGFDLTVDFGKGAGPETFKVSSNPSSVDSDNDGLTDFEEFGAGVWVTNPNERDTDFDLNPDEFDVEPITFDSIEPRDLQLISNGAVTPAPVLSFKLPRVAIDSRNFVTYEVYRQVVNLGEDFTDFDFDTATTCVTNTNCYKKVLSGDNEILTFDPFVLEDTDVAGFNRNYSYLILLTVNGGDPFIVASPTMNTAQNILSVTVELKGFTVNECLDTATDFPCEYFWDFKVGTPEGKVMLNVREEVDSVSVTKGLNFALASEGIALNNRSLTFDVPDLPNSCFSVLGDLYERRSTNVFNTDGDRVNRRGKFFCVDSLASESGNQTLSYIDGYFALENYIEISFPDCILGCSKTRTVNPYVVNIDWSYTVNVNP